MADKDSNQIDLEINEFLSSEFSDDSNNNNKQSDTLNESTVINEALKTNNKYRAKTENQLKKEKAKNVTKIALLIFLFIVILFMIVLVLKTISYQKNNLEKRKKFKETEKIVKIDDNPTDYWKKKMQLRTKKLEDEQIGFTKYIKKEFEEFQNKSEDDFTNLSNELNEQISTINKSVNQISNNIQKTLDEFNEVNDKKLNETNIHISELNKKIMDIESKETEVSVDLPPIKSFSNNKSENVTTEIIYEDLSAQKIEPISTSKEKIKKDEKKQSDKSNKVSLFSGFIKVINLTSIKGPTGSKASSETHPVRLQTMGNLIGANNKKNDLDSCFIKAIAKGDITTVRNHLTINKLYCNGTDKKGDYKIEVNVKGQIYDELDGGLGFPGVLVDSAGKLLTRELSIAVVKGGAQMFNKTENVIFPNIGSLSASNTSFGQEFTSGAAKSVSKGLDGIVNYWRDILKGYYPFIDSKAARVGEAFIEVTSEWNKEYYDSSFNLKGDKTQFSNWEKIID